MKWKFQIGERTELGIIVYDGEIEAPDIIEAAMKAYAQAFEFGIDTHTVIGLEWKGDA